MPQPARNLALFIHVMCGPDRHTGMPRRTRGRIDAMPIAHLAAVRKERQAHHAKTTEPWRAIPADSCSGVMLGTDRHPLGGESWREFAKISESAVPWASDRY